MSTQQASQVLLPVGRIVQGDLYEPQTKDQKGNDLTIKSGPNKGNKTQRYYFAVAIPKGGETHWAQTQWGQQIWQKGHEDWPQLVDRTVGSPTYGMIATRNFAWKVVDGDSTEFDESVPPKRHCDKVGHKGHWVIKLSSSYAPKIYTADGTQPLVEPGYVKRGYWVETLVTVQGNGETSKPGIYINHSLVAYRAGTATDEIRSGPDATQVGFGKAALPTGVSAIPTGNAASFPALPGALPPGGQPVPGAALPGAPVNMPAGVPAGLPAGVPGLPGAATVAAPAGVPAGFPGASPAQTFPSNGMPAGFPAQPTAVAPNAGFLSPPGLPTVPATMTLPPAPPAEPVLHPSVIAGGHTWASLRAGGVTLEQAK